MNLTLNPNSKPNALLSEKMTPPLLSKRSASGGGETGVNREVNLAADLVD
jgi:hypothetical protein